MDVQNKTSELDSFWQDDVQFENIDNKAVAEYVNKMLIQNFEPELVRIAKLLLNFAQQNNAMKEIQLILFKNMDAQLVKKLKV